MSRRRYQACSALFNRRAPEISQRDRYRAARSPLDFVVALFPRTPSITDRGEHCIPYVDCFGGARGLHRAGGASTPSDELLHGGHVRLASHYFLLTYRGRIDM